MIRNIICSHSDGICLACLREGEYAYLQQPSLLNDVVLRLIEMGMTQGTRVRLVRRACFGGPLQIDLRGTHLCLRSHEAQLFPVSMTHKETSCGNNTHWQS